MCTKKKFEGINKQREVTIFQTLTYILIRAWFLKVTHRSCIQAGSLSSIVNTCEQSNMINNLLTYHGCDKHCERCIVFIIIAEMEVIETLQKHCSRFSKKGVEYIRNLYTSSYKLKDLCYD